MALLCWMSVLILTTSRYLNRRLRFCDRNALYAFAFFPLIFLHIDRKSPHFTEPTHGKAHFSALETASELARLIGLRNWRNVRLAAAEVCGPRLPIRALSSLKVALAPTVASVSTLSRSSFHLRRHQSALTAALEPLRAQISSMSVTDG